MLRILFVCTANICRSPLAEAILQHRIDRDNLAHQIESASCGVLAMDGQPSSQLTIEVAKENGIDLSHHRSKSITSWDLRNSSLILTMTPGHREELLNYFSADSDRLYTLKGFLRKNKISNESIDDPYGLNLNFYRRIFNEIENEIDRIYPELKRRI